MRLIKKMRNMICAIPLKGVLGKMFNYISPSGYMKCQAKYLRKLGIDLKGTPKYISPDAYFDGTDYSKIHIGNNITISREVLFLTHDYSITTAVASLGQYIGRGEGEIYFLNPISVGDNVFIGARAFLLPGTVIGDNVIIGGGAVVKGHIPSDSIVVGNPAKIIGSVKSFAEKHIQKEDFFVEGQEKAPCSSQKKS